METVEGPKLAVYRAELPPVVLRPDRLGLLDAHAHSQSLGLPGVRSPPSPSSSSCSIRHCDSPDSLLESGYRSDASSQQQLSATGAAAATLDELGSGLVKLEPDLLGMSLSRATSDWPSVPKVESLDLTADIPDLIFSDEFLNMGGVDADFVFPPLDINVTGAESLAFQSSASASATAAGGRSHLGVALDGSLSLSLHTTATAAGTGAGTVRERNRHDALMDNGFDLDDLPLPSILLPEPLISAQLSGQLVQSVSLAQLVASPAANRHVAAFVDRSDSDAALKGPDETGADEFDALLQ